jgi:hypothetical protein
MSSNTSTSLYDSGWVVSGDVVLRTFSAADFGFTPTENSGIWNRIAWNAPSGAGASISFAYQTSDTPFTTGQLEPDSVGWKPLGASPATIPATGGDNAKQHLALRATLSRPFPDSPHEKQGVSHTESSTTYQRDFAAVVLNSLTINANKPPQTATGLQVGSPGPVLTNLRNPPFSWSAFADDPADVADPLQTEAAARLQVQVIGAGGNFATPLKDSSSVNCSGTCAAFTPGNFTLADGDYQFRVRRQDNGTPGAWSAWSAGAGFTVDATAPVVTGALTAPTGPGLCVAPGQQTSITWKTASVVDAHPGTVLLEFASDGTTFQTIDASEPNDGTFSWTVPAVQSNAYRVRLRATDALGIITAPAAGSVSTQPFTVDAGPPQVAAPTSPTLNQQVTNEPPIPITWNPAQVTDPHLSTVSLYYQLDDGPFELIAQGLPNSGSYVWDLKAQGIVVGQVRLKLEAEDSCGKTAEAIGPVFRVVQPVPARSHDVLFALTLLVLVLTGSAFVRRARA